MGERGPHYSGERQAWKGVCNCTEMWRSRGRKLCNFLGKDDSKQQEELVEASVLDMWNRQMKASVAGVERQGEVGYLVRLKKWGSAGQVELCRFIGLAGQHKQFYLYPERWKFFTSCTC